MGSGPDENYDERPSEEIRAMMLSLQSGSDLGRSGQPMSCKTSSPESTRDNQRRRRPELAA
ncbi:hypothetical protein GCM10010412_097490 [Nonomuraea recticatena]|uniref:Uncharacterized protein n=1 Tax=Nonomuraea recticatena TaxID=46178 RepID=A0ABP6FY76_9ACTN